MKQNLDSLSKEEIYILNKKISQFGKKKLQKICFELGFFNPKVLTSFQVSIWEKHKIIDTIFPKSKKERIDLMKKREMLRDTQKSVVLLQYIGC